MVTSGWTFIPRIARLELNADKVPDETTTQLKTNVIVKDGETIVIGGLFRDSCNNSSQSGASVGRFTVCRCVV